MIDERGARLVRRGVELALHDIDLMKKPWNVLCSLQATARQRAKRLRNPTTRASYLRTVERRRGDDNS